MKQDNDEDKNNNGRGGERLFLGYLCHQYSSFAIGTSDHIVMKSIVIVVVILVAVVIKKRRQHQKFVLIIIQNII